MLNTETVDTHLNATKKLGVPSLVFFVLGAAAPLTILAGFAPLGLAVGGDAMVVGFIIPGLVYLLFTAGFAAMSRHFLGEGAFYAYITRGLGTRIGGAAGMATYVGYAMGQIGFTAAAGIATENTVAAFTGIQINWAVYALIFTVIVSILGYRSVHIGARILGALLVAELAILVVFCIAVLVRGGHEGLSLAAFSPEVVFSAALPAVFVMTFTAFVGFEQTAIYSQEVKDTRRTVSRATYAAIIILAAFYSFCAWTIIQAIGPSRMVEVLAGDPASLVFALNSEFAGEAMTNVMRALIVTSFFAGILALQNACSRYLHALGRTGVLPRPFRRVSATTGAPSVGNFVQATVVVVAIIVFAVLGLDPYRQVVVWTNSPTIIVVLTMQILTSLAVISFFRSDRHDESRWVRVIAPALSAIVITAALILLVSSMGMMTALDPFGNFLIILPAILGAIYGFARVSLSSRVRVIARRIEGPRVDA